MEDNTFPEGITVGEYLRHHTKVGDFIIFTKGGWRIGCTIIDHEDLFFESLSPALCEEKVVKITHQTDSVFHMLKATYIETYRAD